MTPRTPTEGLELIDVGVVRGGRAVVRDVSLRLDPGDWLGVVGPNGAGKSSLLAALAGVLPHGGSITLGQTSARQLSRRERARRVAYLPQDAVVPTQLSVADYVLLGRVPHAGYFGRHSEADRHLVLDVLKRLDLMTLAARPLGSVSGGERQRAQLARALAVQAPVLVADEPTSSLDLGRGQYALELLDELRNAEGLIVITAMHDLTLAGQYPNRVLLLRDGAPEVLGSAGQVLTGERIADCFGARVVAETDPLGRVSVRPQRKAGR
jgi:iron complex transport system ATP-binding protein